MSATVPLLSVEGVSRRFQGVTALSEVSLQVEAGEIMGLVGPNGAGKTTLVNVVTGNLRPTAGQVALGGRVVSGRGMYRVAREGVARTFQNLRLLEGYSVFDNVLTGRHRAYSKPRWAFGISRATEREQRREVESLLDATGLQDFADSDVAALPYGVRRRVEIARALAAQPRLLLLDEPVAGMTRSDAASVAQLVRDTARSGVAVLLVEHDVALVTQVCDRISVLDWGKLLMTGKPADVWADKRVRTAYLGTADES
jgi:branched-chain amino acid transport system ATP-binding protein